MRPIWLLRNRSRFPPSVMSMPLTITRPEVGWSRAPTRCSNVDLPQADGPVMATNSPCSLDRLTPSRARMTPRSKLLWTSMISTARGCSLMSEGDQGLEGRGAQGWVQRSEEGSAAGHVEGSAEDAGGVLRVQDAGELGGVLQGGGGDNRQAHPDGRADDPDDDRF